MSVKNHLASKSGNIAATLSNNKKINSGTSATPKTGPGQLAAFSREINDKQEKITALEKQIKEFEEADQAKLIDPVKIKHSKWSNRISHSFLDEKYIILKEAIKSSRKNVQPIKVRRILNNKEEK